MALRATRVRVGDLSEANGAWGVFLTVPRFLPGDRLVDGADLNAMGDAILEVQNRVTPPPVAWNPGVYVFLFIGTTAATGIALARQSANFKGVWQEYKWKDVEPVQGTYDASAIVAKLDAYHAAGLKFMLCNRLSGYNAGENNSPAWLTGLAGCGGGTYVKTDDVNQVNPVLWNDNVLELVLAQQAFVLSKIDGHPALAGWCGIEESATHLPTDMVPAGNPGVEAFSGRAWADNLMRIGLWGPLNILSVPCLFGFNFQQGAGNETLQNWASGMKNKTVGLFMPDINPTIIPANSIMAANGGSTALVAAADYADLGGAYTPEDLFNYAVASLGASHVIYSERADTFASVVSFVDGLSGGVGSLNVNCPWTYPSCEA